jgi:hypothetical protein
MQYGLINDSGADETTLEASNGTRVLLVENSPGSAITGRGGQFAISGYADAQVSYQGVGVLGQGRLGVWGHGRVAGVVGYSVDYGVGGEGVPLGGYGDGVQGASNAEGSSGVRARHIGPKGGSGVSGTCDPVNGDGFGVYGTSELGAGVGGESSSRYAVQGVATGPGAYAGIFFGRTRTGDLFVSGSLTVLGAKSMAMPHPDGSHRRLYALESPDSWFEDFGSAELAEGHASVDFDADFAAVAQLDDYHVFLTAEGDSKGLYVASKGPTGFEVREQQGGTSSLTFSYRVVARPKGINGQRMERLEPVDVSVPEPVKVPPPSSEVPEVPLQDEPS